VAIDGKTVRRSFDRDRAQGPLPGVTHEGFRPYL